MRLIDADALTEFLKCLLPERGMWEIEGDTGKNAVCETVAEAIEMVKNMETIQPEKAQFFLEGTTKGTTSDLISRQDAIDALNEYFARIGKLKRRGLTEGEKAISLDTVGTIKTLPPAQPEHKVRFADKDHVWIDGKQYISLPRFQEAVKEAQTKEGHWIEVAGELECSECHTVFTDLYPDYADSVACPHCGARMKGERQK